MDAGESSSRLRSSSEVVIANIKLVLDSLVGKNPYRVLGVYGNATSKEVQKNLSRIAAFAKVGRTEEFYTDFKVAFRVSFQRLNAGSGDEHFKLERDEEMVAAAQAQLHSAGDRLLHLCFWWTCATPADEAAFRKLETGDLEGAREIWNRRSNVSAVVNAMTTSWLLADTATVGAKAEELFCTMGDELCALIDPTLRLEPEALIRRFFVALTDVGCRVETLPQGTHEVWRRLWSEYAAMPYLRAIEKEVAAAASLGNVPAENLQAAKRLKALAVRVLPQLKKIYADDVLAYQVQADKLAEAVLQRAIVFFNESEGGEAVYQAMPLQQYALSIAEGEPTRQRCRENVAVLQGWVDDLSPQMVKQHLDRVISAPVESAPVAAASAGTTASAPRQVESPQTKSAASAPAATSVPSSQTSQTAVPQAKSEDKEENELGKLELLLLAVLVNCLVAIVTYFVLDSGETVPIVAWGGLGVLILVLSVSIFFQDGFKEAVNVFVITELYSVCVIILSAIVAGLFWAALHIVDFILPMLGRSWLIPTIAGAIVGLIIGGISALCMSDKENKIGALLSGPVLGAVFGGVVIGVGKLSELILDFLK